MEGIGEYVSNGNIYVGDFENNVFKKFRKDATSFVRILEAYVNELSKTINIVFDIKNYHIENHTQVL